MGLHECATLTSSPDAQQCQITAIIKKVEALHDGGENRCLTVDLSSRAVIEVGHQICHPVRVRRAGQTGIIDRSMLWLPACCCAICVPCKRPSRIKASTADGFRLQLLTLARPTTRASRRAAGILTCDWLPLLDHAVPHPPSPAVRRASHAEHATHSCTVRLWLCD